MKHLSAQHPTSAVNSELLAPAFRSFNPSIIRHDGALLMAYRVQPSEKQNCIIHLAELDEDFQPVDDMRLEVPTVKPNANLEDPRLFIGPDGALCLAWTEATYSNKTNWKCIQRYGVIEKGKITQAHTPKFGFNNYEAKEKNWQFFTHANRVHAIYSHSPQIVIELDGETVANEYKTAGLVWNHGQPSGGTPPVPFNGDLLTFFHAYEADVKHTRKYNMAAAVMESKPPFAILHTSAKPVMYGTEKEAMSPDKRWHPLCVFPGGVVDMGGEFAVSIGVNDALCAVARISQGGLMLMQPKAEEQATLARIEIRRGVMIDGIGRTPGEFLTVDKARARKLIQSNQAIPA